MKYRSIPGIEKPVSVLCLGTQEFSQNDTWWGRQTTEHYGQVLDHALATGINFIDTAELYGESETILGELLDGRRNEVVLASKRSGTEWDYDTVRAKLEQSLKNLRTDFLDLYLLHWPPPTVSPEDAVTAFETLRRLREEDLIRAAGVSNFHLHHLRAFPPEAFELIVVNQVPFNLLWRAFDQPAYAEFCREVGLRHLSFASLAQGLLTGGYTDPSELTPFQRGNVLFNEPVYSRALKVVDLVKVVADEIGASPAEVALRWVVDCGTILSALVGVRTPEEIAQNARALEIELSSEQTAALDAASREFFDPIPEELRLWIPDNDTDAQKSLLADIGLEWKPWNAYEK